LGTNKLSPGLPRRNGSIPEDRPSRFFQRINQRQDSVAVFAGVADKDVAHNLAVPAVQSDGQFIAQLSLKNKVIFCGDWSRFKGARILIFASDMIPEPGARTARTSSQPSCLRRSSF